MDHQRIQCARLLPAVNHHDRSSLTGVLRNEQGVTLCFLFEVVRPWFPSSHLLPTMEDVLEQQLSSLQPGDALISTFEQVLRMLNQTLAQVAESGETDWIGSLSALVMATDGSELHFSHTGSLTAYLVQNNKIRQITEESTSGDVHPQRTFANISSGEIQMGDVLLVANPELYRGLSLDALRRLLSSASPYNSLSAIARELKRSNQRAGMALIARAGDEAVGEPDVVDLERIFEKPHQTMARVAKPHARKAASAIAKGAKSAATAVTTKMLPAVHASVVRVGPKVQKVMTHIRDNAPALPMGDGEDHPLPVLERVYPAGKTQLPAKARKAAAASAGKSATGFMRIWNQPRLRYGSLALVVLLAIGTTIAINLRNRNATSNGTTNGTVQRSFLENMHEPFPQGAAGLAHHDI